MAPRRYRPIALLQTAHRWTGAVRDRCHPHRVLATAIAFVHPSTMALRSMHVLLGCLLVAASAQAARSLTGYLDFAAGEPFWRPPRTEARAEPATEARAFAAPADNVSRGLDFLAEHRRDLPTQAFVFILSDFVVPPDLKVWQRALEHRWELVPVLIQDPVWERTFPEVSGVTVPYSDPKTGRVFPVYLTRREAARLRVEHEQRWDALVRDFRSLALEPVNVHTHDFGEMLGSFLRWADLRQMWRGAVA